MSNTSKFLGSLREAFQELDRVNAAADDSKKTPLPAPIPPSILMERIRANESQHSQPEIVPFRTPIAPPHEIRRAARKGQEISPEILKKLRDNRGDS